MTTKVKSKTNLSKPTLKGIVACIAALILGIVAGSGIGLNIAPNEQGDIIIETEYAIELSDEQVPAIVENAEGELEEISAPTVEQIDSKQSIDDTKLDFGQGAWHDISSPDTYKNSVIGQCIDMDGVWGSQCVDLYADFHYNYTGRWLSTCGTGAAYGLWDCRYENAGDDYDLIEDPTQIQPGDYVIFGDGQHGHVGMALGYYNNGYIALLGENQGGGKCNGGGAAVNIINMSLKTFRGAFRPKIYVKPAPAPEQAPEAPIADKCDERQVEEGDTMSKIMLECEGTVEYGEVMNEYADSWKSTVVVPNQTVYYGWTHGTGYGLFAGDVIKRNAGE